MTTYSRSHARHARHRVTEGEADYARGFTFLECPNCQERLLYIIAVYNAD